MNKTEKTTLNTFGCFVVTSLEEIDSVSIKNSSSKAEVLISKVMLLSLSTGDDASVIESMIKASEGDEDLGVGWRIGLWTRNTDGLIVVTGEKKGMDGEKMGDQTGDVKFDKEDTFFV
jgi:hypothetical protein